MERTVVNPWTWQDQYAFVQANKIEGGERMLLCAGQTSADAQGKTLHENDMAAQVNQAFDNLETVLQEAGFSLGDVVRLNYYTTDVDALFEAWGVVAERLNRAGCRPASTLLGVQRLAFPELLIEIEATAVA